MNSSRKKRIAIIANAKKSKLPSEYQEVEYIKSSGTQYIDTGILITESSLNNGVRFIIKGTFDNFSTNQALGKNISPYFFIGRQSSGKLYSGMGTNYPITPLSSSTANANVMELNSSSKQFIVDGTVVTTHTNISGSQYYGNIWLFGASSSTSSHYYCKMKIYYSEIYTSGQQRRYFIPCYRKLDGVIGMYDLCGSICPLTNTPFYINSGTGTFTKGGDIN